MSTATAATKYRAVAPYITIRADVGDFVPGARNGIGVVGIYRGGILPATADPAAVQRLLDTGRIEELPA